MEGLEDLKRVQKIVLRRLLDPSADLSPLTTRIEDGRIAESQKYSDDDIKKSGLSQVQAWVDQDQVRLREYGSTWQMIGIRADAEIQTSGDGETWLINTISSGGLWGIESDSDENYLEEVETEQLDELKSVLLELGFTTQELERIKVERRSERE